MSGLSDDPSPWGTSDKDHVQKTCYDDGTLREEIHYRGTLEHGWWRQYHPNGVKAAEWWFVLGAYTDVPHRTWYDNGQLQSEQPMNCGRHLEFHPDGRERRSQYWIGGPVSPRKYARACLRDHAIPRFPELDALMTEEASRLKQEAIENPPPKPEPQVSPNEQDGDLPAQLLAQVCEEAFLWLTAAGQPTSRNLGELDWDDSIKLVRRWYAHGAVRVIAAGIASSPFDEVQSTNTLLLQLPTQRTVRKKLFAAYNRHSRANDFDVEADRGQNFLFLQLD